MAIVGYPGTYTAHIDTFARDNLPPADEWPTLRFELPELRFPEKLNCAAVLLDQAVEEGCGERIALYSDAGNWTYRMLLAASNRIARVLTEEQGVVPGNRMLLRGPNSPMLCAAWLAVMKAGAIAVTTMPMLRAKELAQIASKARIVHALCDARYLDELKTAAQNTGYLAKILSWGDGALESRTALRPPTFRNVETASDDVSLLAFTSGTTGNPKATMHFHRDVLIMAEVVGRGLLETSAADIHVGSPPLGFTFGLGALLVFPLRFRAAAVMIEKPTAEALLDAVQKYHASALFTAPTMYKHLAAIVQGYDVTSLRKSVSAGEPLPQATSHGWHAATGIRLIDGLGATEMMHIFISAKGENIRVGATGKPLPGYEAQLWDEHGEPLPAGSSGRLVVRGPTGCRYLADARQKEYVVGGWNVTGDRYRLDQDGYFWFEGRTDDMIVTSGYNIAAAEVEGALIGHPCVKEVAVIGVPDEERGHIVKAFVVLKEGQCPSTRLVKELQDFVKKNVAPYKYPRAVEFVSDLEKTPSGKVQRYVLRQSEQARRQPPRKPDQGN